MKLLICYLTDNNRHFTFDHYIKLLSSSVKKNDWKLMILTHTNDNDFYINSLTKYNINHETVNVNHNDNYLRKVNYAVSFALSNNIPYIMKCDNDIFIRGETLDYMIDNLHLLDTEQNLTLSPVLSSGIPGIEYFKDQFLDEKAKNDLNDLFLKSNFYDRDGASYTFLNKYTLETNKWNREEFFANVKKMSHHYKGIHPIRINYEALKFLNNYIISNKEKFMENKKMNIIYDNISPYLCNSIFCINTKIYSNILNDKTLYVDSYDEVPLNKYAWKHNITHLFVKNGFAIHMFYNWFSNHLSHEQTFCSLFFS